MRAQFIYEFERGSHDPKKDLTMGKKKIRGDFDQHLADVKDQEKLWSDEDKEIKNMVKLYAFIYSDKFEPIEIDGETFHKKVMEIENLYQIDTHDKSDLMSINMMKMRSMHQDGAKLALVDIPSFMHDQKTTYDSEISPQLRKYIKENKRKAFV